MGRTKLIHLFLLSAFIFTFISFTLSHSPDPYSVLGIRRTSSMADIKRAYKQLAKKWHPDKNQSPEAEKKFVQINQAYEILGDPKRKEKYDRYGTTDENDGHGGGQHFDPFASFFHGQFNSKPSFFAKHRIGLRMYENTILEKSHFTPYLIFIYSDWCMMCMRAEGIWERVVNELEPLGYGIATVNSMREGALIDKLRVSHEPSIVVLVEGRPISFRGQVIEVRALIEFARQSIPSHLVTPLDDTNFRQWMQENWRTQNRISAIMSGTQDRPRLRFLLAAMRYRQYASFGYVALKSSSTSDFRSTYGVSSSNRHAGGLETFMIFNERIESPVVSIQAKEIQSENLISALESNRFLILPRLSSQIHFDDLCPPSSATSSMLRQLCIILLVRAHKDDIHLNGFREFVENSTLRHVNDAVRYTYVFEDRQSDFVKALVSSSTTNDQEEPLSTDQTDRRHVIVLWRTDRHQARLAWLRGIWSGHPDMLNQSAETLLAKIDSIRHSRGSDLLRQKVELHQLVDEDSPVWYKRILAKIWNSWETFLHYITKEELFPIISVVGTLFVMLVLGYCVNFMTDPIKPRTDRSHSTYRNHSENANDTSNSRSSKEEDMFVPELNGRSYKEMVTEARPGMRTIVILVSENTKDILLKRFMRDLLPWNENNFQFGYVSLEKNVTWLRELCDLSGAGDALDLPPGNAGNFDGTVLSLVGYRRYFNIYYQEKQSKSKDRSKKSEFLGFDSSSSSDEDDTAKSRLNVLKRLYGLPNWFERLFEGCCQKFSVSEWPAMR